MSQEMRDSAVSDNASDSFYYCRKGHGARQWNFTRGSNWHRKLFTLRTLALHEKILKVQDASFLKLSHFKNVLP